MQVGQRHGLGDRCDRRRDTSSNPDADSAPDSHSHAAAYTPADAQAHAEADATADDRSEPNAEPNTDPIADDHDGAVRHTLPAAGTYLDADTSWHVDRFQWVPAELVPDIAHDSRPRHRS
jgi:hypothetical protein